MGEVSAWAHTHVQMLNALVPDQSAYKADNNINSHHIGYSTLSAGLTVSERKGDQALIS